MLHGYTVILYKYRLYIVYTVQEIAFLIDHNHEMDLVVLFCFHTTNGMQLSLLGSGLRLSSSGGVSLVV